MTLTSLYLSSKKCKKSAERGHIKANLAKRMQTASILRIELLQIISEPWHFRSVMVACRIILVVDTYSDAYCGEGHVTQERSWEFLLDPFFHHSCPSW
jgi:hypothetical protein